MRRICCGLLAVLLLAAPGLAQQGATALAYRTVTFHTSPEGAEVHLLGATPEVLGASGRPIQVLVPLTLNVTLQFSFRLAGYQDGQLSMQSSSLRDSAGRDLPSITLVPSSPSGVLWQAARQHLAALLSLLAGLVAVGVGIALLVDRRVQPRPKAQAARVEDLSMLGKTLGRWRLVEKLGRGGMGAVYRATSPSGSAAVKVINAEYLNNPQSLARFEREVRIGSKLSHPNIVRLLEWDLAGPCYLVMELLDGTSLRARLSPDGLAPRTVLTLMEPVFTAMRYAHEQDVWHRDLKPENIFVTSDHQVKLMDFGMARQSTDATVTGTGEMPVTAGYMSPEQFRGKNVQASSDQYSLGIILWEMLAGQRPFQDSLPMVVVMKHLNKPLPSLHQRRPDIPAAVDAVLRRMCDKDPNFRYADLQVAWEALELAILLS